MKHQWRDRGRLTEPGISDTDGGKWARYLVACTRCGETRRVWVGIPVDRVSQDGGCPWPWRKGPDLAKLEGARG